MAGKQVNLDLKFVIPVEEVSGTARTWLSSDDENRRAVAKAILDVTKEASIVKQGLADDGTVDFAPYFDFWMGDAISAAKELLQSDDETDRTLAECLIAQEEAIIKSKAHFLAEMKRLGIKPKHEDC